MTKNLFEFEMPSLRKLAAMKKTQSRKTKILHNERERVWKDALTYSHHLKRRKDILSILSLIHI